MYRTNPILNVSTLLSQGANKRSFSAHSSATTTIVFDHLDQPGWLVVCLPVLTDGWVDSLRVYRCVNWLHTTYLANYVRTYGFTQMTTALLPMRLGKNFQDGRILSNTCLGYSWVCRNVEEQNKKGCSSTRSWHILQCSSWVICVRNVSFCQKIANVNCNFFYSSSITFRQ